MRLIIIIVALGVALLIAFAVSSMYADDAPPPAPQIVQAPTEVEQDSEKVNVYVAQRDIPVGVILTPSDYDIKAVSKHLLIAGALRQDDPSVKLEGMISATPIVKDEPLLLAKLRNPNDPSFIPGQLKQGMRAMTISVNLVDSVAGFVQPGDKVDIIYTFDIDTDAIEGSDVSATKGGGSSSGEGGEGSQSSDATVSLAEVIIANVKVLAVDQRVGSGQVQGENGQVPQVPASVTVEVSQAGAQKLMLAEKMGKLSLVLRSIKDKDNFDKVRPTAEQDLTRILPPAYFPALFDSDASYDFSVVDLYGNALSSDPAKSKGQSGGPASVNVYRGTDLEKVEVK